MTFHFLFRFWVAMIAGWIHEQQRGVIAFKDAEIRSLREQLRLATGTDRLRFTDAQRRRLAAKAKKLGRAVLREIDPLVTPDTLLRWHRKLIARKYDSSHIPRVGRPPLDQRVKDLIVRMAQVSRRW
ncbi:MAG: hypothetical protein MI741_22805, partial [Rhodospirillales bacterium]|nr:hypothetical protein [Rhodospirillales bacterium]